jgi:MSHA biogenesis protein MshE
MADTSPTVAHMSVNQIASAPGAAASPGDSTRARLRRMRLGQILVEQEVISPEGLARGLEAQKRTGRKLGRVLTELGIAKEEAISRALSRQFNIPFIELLRYELPAEATTLLSETQARRLRAIALGSTSSAVRVAMADPTDLAAFDELERILQREIDLAVVTDRVYRHGSEISGLAEELGRDMADAENPLDGLGLTASADDVPVARLLKSIFEDALRARASDVHLEPQEKSLQVRFRVDGALHLQVEADARIAGAVLLRLKLIAGLDISEKRLPQDGRFRIVVRNVPVDVRISTMPTALGEGVAMRLLVRDEDTHRLDGLGLPKSMADRLRAAMARGNGMILATGPTGSGKSTTLYAALSEINTPQRKIVTVEDPIEYRLPGITQVQVHEKIDLSFGRVLRSVLRHDPDVILVGEMRDAETVETGLRAAMTGHLVFSTLHTNDAASTPVRLIDMGAPAFMVGLSLRIVIAQRLIRLLCEHCAETMEAPASAHAWLTSLLGPERAAAATLRRGSGCAHCNGTGFHGRRGLYEMLEMTPPLAEAASAGDTRGFLKLAALQMKGQTLGDRAAELVAAGLTTVDEALSIAASGTE